MSIAVLFARTGSQQRRRRLAEVGSALLGFVLLVWSLAPLYNMALIALDPEDGDEIQFSGNLWPPEPSLHSFATVVTQQARYLENFWHQFGNSLYIGLLTMLLTLLIGSLASFAVRLRLVRGSLLTGAALLTYAVPASFVIVPYMVITSRLGLLDNSWAVITAYVAFATPFAILILQLYGRLIPAEFDDAA